MAKDIIVQILGPNRSEVEKTISVIHKTYLQESKQLPEGTPFCISRNASEADAIFVKEYIEKLGGTVILVDTPDSERLPDVDPLLRAANAEIERWIANGDESEDLVLNDLNSANGLKLPQWVGSSLYLDGLTSATGLTLPPKGVAGDLHLNGLTSAVGLTLPQTLRSSLYLDGLTSAVGLKLPISVGGSLSLDGLTSAVGLTLPNSVGDEIYLESLSNADKKALRKQYPRLAGNIS